MTAVFLNGRFLDQPVTGVQRFSFEISTAIGRLVENGDWPETAMLAPRQRPSNGPRRIAPFGRRLRLQHVGRTRGHVWEQAELPGAARHGVLVSLGNTAPLLAGRRQVVVIHDAGVFDTPESYSLQFRTWYKTLQHGLARSGAGLVTVSDFSRRRIAARLHLDPARIAVMNEGSEHVRRVAADPETLGRHGLAPRGYALVVGNTVAHKNLACLHDASAALARRGLVLAIAGSVDQRVFNNAGGVPPARLLGRVTDAELRSLYENALCLLFPSRYEGFGLPPVEAMACGCPVLASRGGAVEEICRDNILYFVSDDRVSVVRAIERILDDPALSKELVLRGRVHADGLSWNAAARRLGDVVRLLQ